LGFEILKKSSVDLVYEAALPPDVAGEGELLNASPCFRGRVGVGVKIPPP